MQIASLLAVGLIAGGYAVIAGNASDRSCAVTQPEIAQPARDPNADPFPRGPWYINNDRTIWAGWDAAKLRQGGNKVLWIRPQGTQLKITGRRLDAESRQLVAHIPGGYRTGFQATALTFPSAGCWEIKATAGQSELTFVTLVNPRRDRGSAER